MIVFVTLFLLAALVNRALTVCYYLWNHAQDAP